METPDDRLSAQEHHVFMRKASSSLKGFKASAKLLSHVRL